eukprot:6444398-Alexandrium_andersonii.AAC.1
MAGSLAGQRAGPFNRGHVVPLGEGIPTERLGSLHRGVPSCCVSASSPIMWHLSKRPTLAKGT